MFVLNEASPRAASAVSPFSHKYMSQYDHRSSSGWRVVYLLPQRRMRKRACTNNKRTSKRETWKSKPPHHTHPVVVVVVASSHLCVSLILFVRREAKGFWRFLLQAADFLDFPIRYAYGNQKRVSDRVKHNADSR